MNNPTNLTARQQFIDGLRELADYLAAHPTIPVPRHGSEINLHLDSTDEGGRLQVRKIARKLGATVIDETSDGGHYYAQKDFGPITYRALSIPQSCMAQHYALHSYEGSVIPDTPATR